MYLTCACILFILMFTNVECECPSLTAPIGGQFTEPCETTPGSVCHLRCIGGRLSAMRTCLADGTWSGRNLVCSQSQRRCRPLQAPLNGVIEAPCRLTAGATCTFKCNTGYSLIGTKTLVCLYSTRQWNSQEPKCVTNGANQSLTADEQVESVVGMCPLLPYPKHGIREGICHKNSPVNSRCRFRCEAGYDLHGPSELICQSNGLWNGPTPQCFHARPPFIYSPLMSGFSHGTQYLAAGNKPFFAVPTVAVSTSIPVGEPHCVGLTPPMFGTFQGQCNPGYLGSTCTYFCNVGFTLIGQPILTCDPSHGWSGPAAICQRSTIGGNRKHCKLPTKNSALVVGQCNTQVGGQCFYQCLNRQNSWSFQSNGGQLNSTRVSTCSHNGKWSAPIQCGSNNRFKIRLPILMG